MPAIEIPNETTLRTIRRLQILTIAWMTIEAAFSLWTAWKARSPALAAFGGDSAIELLSASVVAWRFRHPASEDVERRAARIAGGLLFTLAAYLVVASTMSLFGYLEPKTSYLGMGILAAAALIMPWLAREKRRLSTITGSAALRADAAESTLCGYLSLIALAGLALHALWHIAWADPAAALAFIPFVLFEGWQAIHGKPCDCR